MTVRGTRRRARCSRLDALPPAQRRTLDDLEQHDIDVDAARAALAWSGWVVTVQDQGGRNVRLIGRRAGDRLELVIRPTEHVVLARIVGTPIAIGALRESLVTAGPRDLPWPASSR